MAAGAGICEDTPAGRVGGWVEVAVMAPEGGCRPAGGAPSQRLWGPVVSPPMACRERAGVGVRDGGRWRPVITVL